MRFLSWLTIAALGLLSSNLCYALENQPKLETAPLPAEEALAMENLNPIHPQGPATKLQQELPEQDSTPNEQEFNPVDLDSNA